MTKSKKPVRIARAVMDLAPDIPARIRRIVKTAYRTESKRIANKKAGKSITRQQ